MEDTTAEEKEELLEVLEHDLLLCKLVRSKDSQEYKNPFPFLE